MDLWFALGTLGNGLGQTLAALINIKANQPYFLDQAFGVVNQVVGFIGKFFI